MRIRLSQNHYILLAIIFAATLLRFEGLNHGIGHHPDERGIVMEIGRLAQSAREAKLFDWEAWKLKRYDYGSLVFYLPYITGRVAAAFLPFQPSYDNFFIHARVVSIAAGVAAIWFCYALAVSLCGSPAAGLIAASLLGFNLFHLQLSHFYTADIMLSTFSVGAIWAAVRAAQTGMLRWYLLGAISTALAFTTKVSGLTLLLPLGCAFISACQQTERRPRRILLQFAYLCAALLIGILVVRVVQPGIFLDWAEYLRQTNEQLKMVRGEWMPPYAQQYIGTAAYIYPLKQIFLYTMGIPVALAVISALMAVVYRQFARPSRGELIVLSWLIPVFISIAGQAVKFPRYLLPLYPVLFALAGALLFQLWHSKKRFRIVLRAVTAAVLLYSVATGISFSRLYSSEHVFTTASRWIYQNIPAGSSILYPHWDETLPLHLPGQSPAVYRTFNEGNQWDLPLYEDDTPAKMELIYKRLSKADYIIFPTTRIFRGVLAAEKRYKHSSNLLRLLAAGELGYDSIQIFKVYPALGPLIFDDDGADESLVVYDHPKVMIFKNQGRLSIDALRAKVESHWTTESLPDLYQILSVKGDKLHRPASGSKHSSIGGFLLWFAAFQILGFMALPIAALILPAAPDGGWGVSKALGFLVFGIIAWLLDIYGICRTSVETLFVLLAVMLLFAHLLVRAHWSGWRRFLSLYSNNGLPAELLFFGAFVVFSILRSFNPEIYWGEKPMDFSFLNYMVRLDNLPPQDPWAAGHTMSYYYLGYYLFALIHKITGVDSRIGYNLAIAVIPALLIPLLYSGFFWLTKRRRFSILSALAVVAVSNLEGLYTLFLDRTRHWHIDFDLFWRSARGFTSPAITEYPLWSVLFADLHPHLMAIPFTALALVLGLRLLIGEKLFSLSVLFHRVLLAVVLAALFAINSWDFITYGFVTAVLILLRPWRLGGLSIRRDAALRIGEAVLLSAVGWVILAPFLGTTNATARLHHGWVQPHEFNQLGQLLRHLGVWLLLVGVSVVWSMRHSAQIFGKRVWLALLLALTPLVPAFYNMHMFKASVPFGIMLLAGAMLALAVLIGWQKKYLFRNRAVAVFLVVVGVLIAGTELHFLMDRMNTIFKFYNAIWLLLAVAGLTLAADIFRALRMRTVVAAILLPIAVILPATALLFYLGSELRAAPVRGACLIAVCLFSAGVCVGIGKRRRSGRDFVLAGILSILLVSAFVAAGWLYSVGLNPSLLPMVFGTFWSIAAFVCGLALPWLVRLPVEAALVHPRTAGRLLAAVVCLSVGGLALAQSALNLKAMTTHARVPGPRPTMDGLAYLQLTRPEDAPLVEWLRSSVRGTPTLVEAQGHSYGEFNRIVMYTGIPALIGWEHHIQQRGLRHDEYQQRVSAVRRIYGTTDPDEAFRYAQHHGVDLIVVGELERRTYGDAETVKFASRPDLFPVLFKSGDNAVYTRKDILAAQPLNGAVILSWR